MARFDLNAYEEVKDRLPRFLEKAERPRIVTELMSAPELAGRYVLFRALLFDGDELLATGWAYEERTNGNGVNATSWVENCETSAIGRALANIGLHGDKRPSREEMAKAERMAASQPSLAKELAELIAEFDAAGKKAALAKALGEPKTQKDALKAYMALSEEERSALRTLL